MPLRSKNCHGHAFCSGDQAKERHPRRRRIVRQPQVARRKKQQCPLPRTQPSALRLQGSLVSCGIDPRRQPRDDAAAGPAQVGRKPVSEPPPYGVAARVPTIATMEDKTLQVAGAPETRRAQPRRPAGTGGRDPFTAFEGRLLDIAPITRGRIGNERGNRGAPNGKAAHGGSSVGSRSVLRQAARPSARSDAVQITMKTGDTATEGKCRSAVPRCLNRLGRLISSRSTLPVDRCTWQDSPPVDSIESEATSGRLGRGSAYQRPFLLSHH